ncbi:hypothetical protein EHP00_659 [Ecytonucleospora hepatopenaei]|uniref:Myb-like domain-containing protein n=1 Tax=Ecytonucleospora hepatopenaei TaxID=646526 RepID=A0A1W0E858_9MICR|nr:hypothetical protein EHP00_2549 [Ecytonucleospora hepatopenaei]OQS55602.1 hypothetical protein EHP00_659 [Ecytonucleospora hepatopenaei]
MIAESSSNIDVISSEDSSIHSADLYGETSDIELLRNSEESLFSISSIDKNENAWVQNKISVKEKILENNVQEKIKIELEPTKHITNKEWEDLEKDDAIADSQIPVFNIEEGKNSEEEDTEEENYNKKEKIAIKINEKNIENNSVNFPIENKTDISVLTSVDHEEVNQIQENIANDPVEETRISEATSVDSDVIETRYIPARVRSRPKCPWTEEEIDALEKAVEETGQDWYKIWEEYKSNFQSCRRKRDLILKWNLINKKSTFYNTPKKEWILLDRNNQPKTDQLGMVFSVFEKFPYDAAKKHAKRIVTAISNNVIFTIANINNLHETHTYSAGYENGRITLKKVKKMGTICKRYRRPSTS